MLPDESPSLHDQHSDAAVQPFTIPDDVQAELDELYANEAPITEAELEALCAAEELRRESTGATIARGNIAIVEAVCEVLAKPGDRPAA